MARFASWWNVMPYYNAGNTAHFFIRFRCWKTWLPIANSNRPNTYIKPFILLVNMKKSELEMGCVLIDITLAKVEHVFGLTFDSLRSQQSLRTSFFISSNHQLIETKMLTSRVYLIQIKTKLSLNFIYFYCNCEKISKLNFTLHQTAIIWQNKYEAIQNIIINVLQTTLQFVLH